MEAKEAHQRQLDKVDLDERNHYNGRSLRLVAQEHNCKIPPWWYNTVQDVVRKTHSIEWRVLGDEGDNQDAAFCGVFVEDADYRNLQFTTAYLGFPSTNALKCFTQTDGLPPL